MYAWRGRRKNLRVCVCVWGDTHTLACARHILSPLLPLLPPFLSLLLGVLARACSGLLASPNVPLIICENAPTLRSLPGSVFWQAQIVQSFNGGFLAFAFAVASFIGNFIFYYSGLYVAYLASRRVGLSCKAPMCLQCVTRTCTWFLLPSSIGVLRALPKLAVGIEYQRGARRTPTLLLHSDLALTACVYA